MELSVDLRGDIFNYGHLASFYAVVGETDKSRELLEKMRNLTDDLKGAFSNFGIVHACLGEWDRAFELFDLAVEGREGHIFLLQGWIAHFPKIKEDPRFTELANRIGLPF